MARIRSFNRLVTERVGALNDRFLARDRPLGEARVLWEIGEGAEVRALRARLGLDSGYLSRLLRSLEADRLIVLASDARDARVRTARPTAAGRKEQALLDRRNDELARSFLAPLSTSQRTRLVTAMGEVEALLTAGLVDFEVIDPAHPDAEHCLRAYFSEIDTRFDGGFEAGLSGAPTADEFRPPTGLFLVARLKGRPVGCGALKTPTRRPPEIKRMWVDPSVRGLGVGRRLLAEIEQRAAATGARRIRLETNRALREAIGLYRATGYAEVEAFNDEHYAHHWFEKRLRD